jgi:hypothetical protein
MRFKLARSLEHPTEDIELFGEFRLTSFINEYAMLRNNDGWEIKTSLLVDLDDGIIQIDNNNVEIVLEGKRK